MSTVKEKKTKPKKLLLKNEFKTPTREFLETEFEKLKSADIKHKKQKENNLLLSKEF